MTFAWSISVGYNKLTLLAIIYAGIVSILNSSISFRHSRLMKSPANGDFTIAAITTEATCNTAHCVNAIMKIFKVIKYFRACPFLCNSLKNSEWISMKFFWKGWVWPKKKAIRFRWPSWFVCGFWIIRKSFHWETGHKTETPMYSPSGSTIHVRDLRSLVASSNLIISKQLVLY